MPRKPRVDYSGAVHHVCNRGNERQVIFRDFEDYDFFLRRLKDLKDECGFKLYGYCLMPNHFHLAIQTGPVPLSKIMLRLLTAFSRVSNDHWQTVGHRFQGRYKNRLCRSDNDLRTLIRYIHMNPVEAGLTSNPRDWRWSGHQAILNNQAGLLDVGFVRSLFEDEITNYEEFLAMAPTKRDIPTLEEIASTITGQTMVGRLSGPERDKNTARLRRSFIEAALAMGHRQVEIAKFLNRSKGAICQILKSDPKLSGTTPEFSLSA